MLYQFISAKVVKNQISSLAPAEFEGILLVVFDSTGVIIAVSFLAILVSIGTSVATVLTNVSHLATVLSVQRIHNIDGGPVSVVVVNLIKHMAEPGLKLLSGNSALTPKLIILLDTDLSC